MAAKRVSIKDLAVDMDIKTKGLELDVYDGDTHLGDLYVTKTGLVWCKGKTTKRKGVGLGHDRRREGQGGGSARPKGR
jgi:hypothetical protein